MNLYIMRHGETDWNKKGLIQGRIDIPLNEDGVAAAIKTREGFEKEYIVFDKIFSSPYIRAMKTAEIIAETKNTPVISNSDIQEMSFGDYEGVSIYDIRVLPEHQEFHKCFCDPVHYQRQGEAESYEEIFTRIRRFLETEILPLENTCENVLVVCHGAIIRCFLSIIKNLPLEDYWKIHQPNCSVNIAKLEHGVFTMIEESRIYYDESLVERRGPL